MRRRVKIDFWDFWSQLDRYDNFFTQLLSKRFDVEVSDDPEISCGGKRHRSFRGIRIYYTAENRRPDFCACDYALSFDYLDRVEHCRFP